MHPRAELARQEAEAWQQANGTLRDARGVVIPQEVATYLGTKRQKKTASSLVYEGPGTTDIESVYQGYADY